VDLSVNTEKGAIMVRIIPLKIPATIIVPSSPLPNFFAGWIYEILLTLSTLHPSCKCRLDYLVRAVLKMHRGPVVDMDRSHHL
jgi:hypothetical protein